MARILAERKSEFTRLAVENADDLLLDKSDVARVAADGTVPRTYTPVGNISTDKPICVDLDGTIISTNLFVESFLSILSSRQGFANLPRLLSTSITGFRRRVVALADLAAGVLPYNSELIEYLSEIKRKGGTIVLATSADERSARLIADHLGFFDQVVAFDGVRNLKGAAKAQELVRRFGRKGFHYVGNGPADVPVWREADGIIIVNASKAVSKQAHAFGNVVAEFSGRSPLVPAALRAMRPQHWVKNLLCFVPLLTSRSFTDVPGLLAALCMFASFCMTASGIYLVNDLMDLATDRRHPRKRFRPFASGALPLKFGAILAGALLGIGLVLALRVGALHVILAYAVISIAYSLSLKEFPLLDVFILAAVYVLRVIAGGVASHHPVSLWLLAFAGFTFLSLALLKRTAEMPHIGQTTSKQAATRRGYLPEDGPVLLMFGIAAAFGSSIVLALFVGSLAAFEQYRSPEMLWMLVPLILFWLLRLWLVTGRGRMHDDPIIYASRDWVSWLVATSALAIMALAS